ncbi:MAG: DUF192 domain-containing protein [Candidatus Woesearchaeota archaeon]
MEKQHGIKGIIFLLLLAACATVPVVTFDNGVSFEVEIARTPAEQQKGLMYRESLPENRGMLFIFSVEEPKTFWMKNTLIPLDMVFLDGNMVVVEVKTGVPPCKADPCLTYTSEKPAQYVLELNANVAEKYGIVPGRKMSLRE